MRELETTRLLIRSFGTADLDAYARLLATSFDPPADPHTLRDRLAYYELGERVLAELHQPPYGDRAVVLKETRQLIGAVGFVPSLGPFGRLPFFGGAAQAKFTPEVGLFWAVAAEHRRNGFATEAARALLRYAFDELSLRRVVATTEYDNTASAAVMRRIGMTIQHNPASTPRWFQIVGILEPD
jgi:[ribosomal protein S5]-alanine N-acetyltransferase